MNDRWNASWNAPSVDGLSLESNDSRASPAAYPVSPFADNTEPVAPAEPARPSQTLNRKALARIRNSPAYQLLDGSPWTLKAYQLDMDSPPTLKEFIEQQCANMLREQGCSELSARDLRINFSNDIYPGIEPDGTERHECALTVVELALTSLEPAAFIGLIRSMEADRALHPGVPSLTLKKLTWLITRSRWLEDYQALLTAFWQKHEATYRLLASLSFVDGLCRLRSQRKISLDGYRLALDALGLTAFPASLDSLEHHALAPRSIVSLVVFDGRVVPGIFQLKSRTTSHCYLHVLGEQPQCIEYICEDAAWKEQPLLDALNRSPWHRRHLDADWRKGKVANLVMRECNEDLFSALTQAQREFSSLDLTADLVRIEPDDMGDSDRLCLPINRSLRLIGALDIWGEQSDIRAAIPDPLKTANRLMQRWLKREHGLDADPEHVFIRYLRGTCVTPLGHARAPATDVRVPSLQPITLGQAVLNNYRVEHPVGYIDQGGRTVVYLDPTGAGDPAQDNELSITAQAIEEHLRSVDFLGIMVKQLQRFWHRQGSTVELSLRRKFVAQALVSLKCAQLTRNGFDLLVDVLQESIGEPPERKTRWSALGFHLQRAVLPGTHCPCCAGLLVFSHDERPGYVLYQAGQQEPFFEFEHRHELGAHLMRSAAEPHWRATVLSHVPLNQHRRLEYILSLWGQVRAAPEPSSDLRPWVDALYHEDVHKTKARDFCEHPVTSSPFVFMCQTLRGNSLIDTQDSVITSEQVSIRNWTQRLNHLQLLLAPLSLLVAPAALASIATAAGMLYLDIQSANLPGSREQEKRQLLLTALSLGMLQTGALTPGLMRAARSLTTTHGIARRAVATTSRGFTSLLQSATDARNTQLERFFGSASLLKTWAIPGFTHLATSPVKAWKLDGKFLLWTAEHRQARTLVVSTHGYYLPWSKTAAIPNGTELRTYVPHGFELVDPRLHRVVSQSVQPFSLMTTGQNTPGPAFAHLPAWQLTDKALAGTSQPGRIKNYTLGKFQSERYESYRDISNVVRHSNQSPLFGQLMPTPMDVLTVRNRFGTLNPTLQELFGALAVHGIHYDHILLLHCRCSVVSSMLGRAPAFSAPAGSVPISP